MIKTIINGSGESVAYADRPEFDTPTSNVDVYMLASVDPISPPDAREWDFTVDIPNESISTLPNGYTIMIADTREAIENGHNYKLLFRKSEYNGIEHYRVKVNAPFYIGVGNTDTPIPLGDLSIYTVETFYNFSFAFSILGNSDKCILYKGDMEPCALYVNGERQDALSYSTRSVNGSNSVQYASKYKNNLRTLSFSGNTEQAQYRGVNMFNINAPLLASPFSVEAIAKPKIENGIIYSGGYNESTLGGIDGCFLFVATDGDGDYTFSFNANCTAIESGMRFRIVGAEDVDGTTYDTGPWDYLSAPAEITGNGKYTLTVDNNGYSYIGIAFYSPTRYNIVVTNLQIEKGSVATAHEPYVSKNLFDQEWLLNNSDFTKAEYNGFDCIKAYPTSTNAKDFIIPTTIPSGSTVSVSIEFAHPDTGSNFAIFLLYEDDTTLAMTAPYYTEASSEYRKTIATKQATQNVVGLQFRFYGIYANRPYYFKDIMFNIGEPLPYEPYYEPPTIASPQLISNCGNSQVDVTLRGKNLFDVSKVNGCAMTSTTTPDIAGNAQFGTVSEGILHLKWGNYANGTIWTGASIPIKQGGDYYISFEFMCESTILASYGKIQARLRNFTKGVYSSNAILINDDNVRDVWQVKASTTAWTVPDDWVGDKVYLQLQVTGSATQYSNIPAYAKNIMISYGEAKPYEPYFNSSVSIPANVGLESGANDIYLELAGLGDVKDTITIDRVNNKVKYTQRICRVRPFVNVGGTLSYGGGGGSNTHDLWTFSLDKWSKMPETVVCEFARVLNEDDYTSLGATEFGVFFVYEDYIYIYIPKSLGINSTQALEDYLTLTSGWGVSLFYALDEPVEWDLSLTNKELNDNLLSWARGTKNLTNIIEITATPSAQDTSASYAMWEESNANNT